MIRKQRMTLIVLSFCTAVFLSSSFSCVGDDSSMTMTPSSLLSIMPPQATGCIVFPSAKVFIDNVSALVSNSFCDENEFIPLISKALQESYPTISSESLLYFLKNMNVHGIQSDAPLAMYIDFKDIVGESSLRMEALKDTSFKNQSIAPGSINWVLLFHFSDKTIAEKSINQLAVLNDPSSTDAITKEQYLGQEICHLGKLFHYCFFGDTILLSKNAAFLQSVINPLLSSVHQQPANIPLLDSSVLRLRIKTDSVVNIYPDMLPLISYRAAELERSSFNPFAEKMKKFNESYAPSSFLDLGIFINNESMELKSDLLTANSSILYVDPNQLPPWTLINRIPMNSSCVLGFRTTPAIRHSFNAYKEMLPRLITTRELMLQADILETILSQEVITGITETPKAGVYLMAVIPTPKNTDSFFQKYAAKEDAVENYTIWRIKNFESDYYCMQKENLFIAANNKDLCIRLSQSPLPDTPSLFTEITRPSTTTATTSFFIAKKESFPILQELASTIFFDTDRVYWLNSNTPLKELRMVRYVEDCHQKVHARIDFQKKSTPQ